MLTNFFCVVYTNSLLASLNARKVLARGNNGSSEGTTSLSLRDLPKIGQVNKSHTSLISDFP
jgi:hypothetical protein